MSSTYRSIPYSATDTASASVLRYQYDHLGNCIDGSITDTVTKTVSVTETDPTEYHPILEDSWRIAPTDGRWSDIRESGEIKMTPMSVGKSRIQNYVCSTVKDKYEHAVALATCIGALPNCKDNQIRHGYDLAHINYIEQGDLTYWRTRFPDAPYFGLTVEFDEARWERIKAGAYQDLFQAYNLGEELYELRDTLKTLVSLFTRAYKLLSAFKETMRRIDRMTGKAKKVAIAKAWLELRYGIMPIAYSIKDLLNLADDAKSEYRTVRRTYTPTVTVNYDYPPSGNYFYEVGTNSVLYRCTVKGRWASSRAKVFDLVNINPLTTAFAVFKYSLVVRWFINLNSVIDSWVKSFTSSAIQYVGVTSVRIKREISVHFHYEYDSRKSWYFNGYSSTCGDYRFTPIGPYEAGNVSTFEMLLQTIEEDSYERELFLPTDTRFVWDPVLNLERLLDALAMIISRFSRL